MNVNNKIIVIIIAFILLFTINLTLNNSHASLNTLNALYNVPITIINSQNISTPNPYQQQITLNESEFKGFIVYNGDFANFEFSYSNGTIIPAWIQQNNSGNLIIWLKLHSINASSSIIIYLDIFSLNDNLLSNLGNIGIGEAPGLSEVYGEYDNGNYVFSIYINGNTPLSDFSIAPNFKLSRTANGYLNLTGISAWSGNGDIPFYYNKISLPPYYDYIAEGYGKWWLSDMKGLTDLYGQLYSPDNISGDTDIISLIQTGGSQYTDAIGVEGIPGAIKGENATSYIYYAFGIDLFSDGGFHQSIDNQGIAGGNWVYASITYIAGASNFTAYESSSSGSYSFSYYNPILKNGVNLYLGIIGSETAPPQTPLISYLAHAWYQWLYVRCISPDNTMPNIIFGKIHLISVQNPGNENLEFNAQDFSFIINPLLIIYLIIFIFLFFIIFMAVVIIKRGYK